MVFLTYESLMIVRTCRKTGGKTGKKHTYHIFFKNEKVEKRIIKMGYRSKNCFQNIFRDFGGSFEVKIFN